MEVKFCAKFILVMVFLVFEVVVLVPLLTKVSQHIAINVPNLLFHIAVF